MKRPNHHRPRGHNLLEMLLATVIFATAMISVATVFQYIATQTARSRTRIVGQYLAKGLMERCIALKFTNVHEMASLGDQRDAIPANYQPVTMTYRKDGAIITTQFDQEVQVDRSVEPMFSIGNTGAHVVRVRVTWSDQNRRGATGRPFAEYRTFIGENS